VKELPYLKHIHSVKFSNNGKNYEIRIFSDEYELAVKVFENEKQANGFRYCVTLPVAFNLNQNYGVQAMNALIEHAKNDVIEQRWETYWEGRLQEERRARVK
jgi:hypothetical protein